MDLMKLALGLAATKISPKLGLGLAIAQAFTAQTTTAVGPAVTAQPTREPAAAPLYPAQFANGQAVRVGRYQARIEAVLGFRVAKPQRRIRSMQPGFMQPSAAWWYQVQFGTWRRGGSEFQGNGQYRAVPEYEIQRLMGQ